MSSSLESKPPTSSVASITELKVYQAFIFSVPIFFTFILLFLFYLFYLRRRRLHWAASLRIPTTSLPPHHHNNPQLGLKKELREMLPIIVYKESFLVKDSQCPVCLGDYQAEDRLQQIPLCGHTFHMDCIDHWLANHSTCPLCRLSLLALAKVTSDSLHNQEEADQESSTEVHAGETSVPPRRHACEELQAMQFFELRNEDPRVVQTTVAEEGRTSEFSNEDRELRNTRTTEESETENNGSYSAVQSHA